MPRTDRRRQIFGKQIDLAYHDDKRVNLKSLNTKGKNMRDLNLNEIEAVSGGAGLSYTIISIPTLYPNIDEQQVLRANGYTSNTYNS